MSDRAPRLGWFTELWWTVFRWPERERELARRDIYAQKHPEWNDMMGYHSAPRRMPWVREWLYRVTRWTRWRISREISSRWGSIRHKK